MRPKVKKMILIAPFAIVGIAFFIFLGGWIVMHLWNWLMPALFGWHIITFWQAFGLLFLCRILFGGVSGRGWHNSRSGRRMRDGWHRMNLDEREKFRAAIRNKWGSGDGPAQENATGV
jgi:uncharacterized membrane protein